MTEHSLLPVDPLENSAAGRMLKALLSIEWRRNGGGTLTCEGCGSWTFQPVHRKAENTLLGFGCLVDEALTAAGYPDQASRDAARDIVEREYRRVRDERERERWQRLEEARADQRREDGSG
jgi:hypothetical protein